MAVSMKLAKHLNFKASASHREAESESDSFSVHVCVFLSNNNNNKKLDKTKMLQCNKTPWFVVVG